MTHSRGRVALFAAVVILSLVAAPAATATFTDAFEDLRDDLELRRDGDFLDDPLSKDAKKRQKAVLKSLALLDRPAEDLGDDLATFVAVAKALEKGYRESLAAEDQPLQDLLWEVRGALIGTFDGEVAAVRTGIGKLEPSRLKEKAGGLLAAAEADSHTSFVGEPVSFHAKLLVRSGKKLDKANALAGKGTVLPAPSMYFYVDGAPYPADTISWVVDTVSHSLQITGSFTNPETGDILNCRLQATNVTGPGTYPLQSNPYSLGYWVVPPSFLTEFWSTDPTGGSVTIDALDVENSSVVGSFTFTATGGPSETQVTVTGTFSATWNLTLTVNPE